MPKRRSTPPPASKREIVVDAGDDYRIIYDRETKDYAVEYRGQPVGWRPTESEARRLVDQLRREEARRA